MEISKPSIKTSSKSSMSRYFDRKHIVLYVFGLVYLTFFLNLLFWNNLNYILWWFILFFTMLIWWLEFDYDDFDKKTIIKLLAIIFVWSAGITLVTNIYIWLWYFVVNIGIVYALYSCFWYKHSYRKFHLWSYAMHWLIFLAYFMWFGVWFFVIWHYSIVDFNCNKIYWYFNQITTTFDPTHYIDIDYKLFADEDNSTRQVEKDISNLSWVDTKAYFLQKRDDIKLTFNQYKTEFLNDVITQRKVINQEFCEISIKQINKLYQSDGIRLWVIAFMWLFLYPFFMILFLLYWFISRLLLRSLLLFGVWKYKKKTDEVTYIW